MRYWSLLFALAGALCLGLLLYAPLNRDWWLPNYWATNGAARQPLAAAASGVRSLADAEAAILNEVQGARAARDGNPERIANLDRKLGDLIGKLETERKAAAGLARKNILAGRTGAAEKAIGEALEALAASRGELTGDTESAARGLETARAAIERAAGELEQALVDAELPASKIARDVDQLFLMISAIVGLVFFGTQVAIVYATWRFRARPGRKAVYSHGSQFVEILWTIIPGGILAFLAIYQMGVWAEIKFPSDRPDVPPVAEVTGRQFQWTMRYPGDDGTIGTADDLVLINDLHLIKGESAVILLRSDDVLHSFYLPQMRIKQDAVPGLTIPVWFDADKSGLYELVCAELCGWGHYTMRATVVVHEGRDDFDAWYRRAFEAQREDKAPRQSAALRQPQGTTP
ncbi:MAG: cytochrome c oxidase subunit II [Isosphaeraceae bacterium]